MLLLTGEVPRKASVIVACLVLVACSSDPITYPMSSVLVYNATCRGGSCLPMRVFAVDARYVCPPGVDCVDAPPPSIALGSVDSASACLLFPHSVAAGDSTLAPTGTVMTAYDPFDLYARDTTTYPESGEAHSPFVPADAQSWTITIDTVRLYNLEVETVEPTVTQPVPSGQSCAPSASTGITSP
jgi:hypothetical protein